MTMDRTTEDATASFLGAAASSFRVAAAAMRHGAANATLAPNPRAIRAALVLAARTLTANDSSAVAFDAKWVTHRPVHAAKAVEAMDAAACALTAAGPPLSPSAHAALVAVVLAAYDAGCRDSAAARAHDGVDDARDVPRPRRRTFQRRRRASRGRSNGASRR